MAPHGNSGWFSYHLRDFPSTCMWVNLRGLVSHLSPARRGVLTCGQAAMVLQELPQGAGCHCSVCPVAPAAPSGPQACTLGRFMKAACTSEIQPATENSLSCPSDRCTRALQSRRRSASVTVHLSRQTMRHAAPVWPGLLCCAGSVPMHAAAALLGSGRHMQLQLGSGAGMRT